jgi:hypothetical protein
MLLGSGAIWQEVLAAARDGACCVWLVNGQDPRMAAWVLKTASAGGCTFAGRDEPSSLGIRLDGAQVLSETNKRTCRRFLFDLNEYLGRQLDDSKASSRVLL